MSGSRIFICYRRSDSGIYAGKLYDDLLGEFGDHGVFMDLQGRDLGGDFVARIHSQIDACAVLLVVIGPDWLNATDDDEKRRLDDPDDLVRIEIEAGLAREGVVVIPLFVRGARPPKPAELPPSLSQLWRLDGQILRDQDWTYDLGKVVDRLRKALRDHPAPPPDLGKAPVAGPSDPTAPGSTVEPGADPRPREDSAPDPEARRRRRRWGLVVLGLAGILLIIGLVYEPPTVRIGALYALEGANKAAGRESLSGVKFAVDYINTDDYPDLGLPLKPGEGLPSLDGAKLDPVTADVGPDRCDTRAAFDRLVKERHVVAVLGAYESTVTQQAIYAANRLAVPLVNGTATAATLTEPDDTVKPPFNPCGSSREDPTPSPWFTRVGPSDAQFASLFGRFIAHQRVLGKRVETAAILYENNDIYGEGAVAVTANLARKLGIRLSRFPYDSQLSVNARKRGKVCPERRLVKAMDRQVRAIKSLHPGVVFAASYLPDAVVAMQTMSKVDYTPPALLTYGAGYAESAFKRRVEAGDPGCDLPPGDVRGTITRAAGGLQLRSKQARRAAKLFQDHYGIPMTDKAARAFTATIALAEAIDDAGSTKPKRIQNAMRSLSVAPEQTILPGRGIEFDEYGQNTAARGVLLQALGTDNAVVYPLALATATAVWPMKNARG